MLYFLDVEVRNENNLFSTSVFVKETSNGSCINFRSICPSRYKEGLIKTLLHRAYDICSDWTNFDRENTN